MNMQLDRPIEKESLVTPCCLSYLTSEADEADMNKPVKPPKDLLPGSIHKTKNYGLCEVIKYGGCFNVTVRFIETGYESIAHSNHVRYGSIKDKTVRSAFSVGFNGDGRHPTSKNGKTNPAYSCWRSMLERCYSSEYHKVKPTYKGCITCKEWHNFQNFADWYESNYPLDGKKYQIDKDIKVEGNKLYSPDLCLFVSGQENVEKATAKNHRLISRGGEPVVVYNLRKFCLENGLDHGTLYKTRGPERSMHKGWRLL